MKGNKEELKRLAEIAENDKDFAEKFMAAAKAKNADEAIRLAAEKGFTLTAEDFDFNGKRELDQEELEHVAGGWTKCEGGLAQFLCYLLIVGDLWFHEMLN